MADFIAELVDFLVNLYQSLSMILFIPLLVLVWAFVTKDK